MELVGSPGPRALFLRTSALMLVYVYVAEELLVEGGRGGGGRGGSSGSRGSGGSSGRGSGGSRKRYKGGGFDFGDDDYDDYYYGGDGDVDRKLDSSFIVESFREWNDHRFPLYCSQLALLRGVWCTSRSYTHSVIHLYPLQPQSIYCKRK